MLRNDQSLLEEILFYLQQENNFEVFVEDDIFIIGSKAFCQCDLTEEIPKAFRRAQYLSYLKKGIQLFLLPDVSGFALHIFIKAKLGLLPKIYARKTTIKEINQKTFSEILNSYHIQGATNSTIRYGLFFDDRLVGAMGFIRNGSFFNLNRLVFSDVAVVGGASKLLGHFRSKNSGPIVTFSNNGYSDGGIYKTLGFKFVNEESTDMWYTKEGRLLNRRKFQKKAIEKILPIFDISKTEVQNMIDNGYGVYYGPGTKRWELE